MDYICDALNRAGNSMHIISPAWFSGSDAPFSKSTTTELSGQKRFTLAPSFGVRSKPARLVQIILALGWLFFYLVRHARRNEKILAYHTPWLSLPLRWAKRIKRFHLVLEVEEVYGDATPIGPLLTSWETKLLASADAYLFATELLKERVGKRMPCCIIYGRYQTEDSMARPPNDRKTHLLYAGIIDSHKKGAFNALECTKYLSSDYVLHIIGFGEVDKLQKRIDELNSTIHCQVVFDGTMRGDDYIRYAQSCHIGLSTQAMDGNYLATSFPSKILSYLCMGLRVVSCHVECVSKSQVDSLVSYYYEDSPEAIARAIKSVDLRKPFDSRSALRRLDAQFIKDIDALMQEGEHA
jgi:hypothetical protein